jgi:hypothetical protein
MADSSNKQTSGGRWLALAGVTVLATGYLVYGYATRWKGPAYNFWCPARRQRPVRSHFHAQVDSASETQEMDARAWMERYVKTILKRGSKSAKAAAKGQETETPRTTAMKSGLGAHGGESSAERRHRRNSRADSLIRDGTGPYAEELGDCIATEKGLLKREDFLQVQKVIEIYSKAVLSKMR